VELFKITCVTCKSKLSVRNREIIGQIVACPRCESMVQVEAPIAAAGVVAAVPPEPEGNAAQNVVAEQPAQLGDFSDAAVEAATGEAVEPLPSEESSLQVVASVAKYRLVAWTLASFAVGAAVGGAALFLRGDSVAESVGSAELASDMENAKAVAVLEISERPPMKAAESTKLRESVSEETVSAAKAVVTAELEQEVATEPIATKTQATAQPRVASRFDALDLDPDTLDLETLKSAAGKQAAEKPPVVLPENVEPLKDSQPVQAATLPVVRRDPDQGLGAKTQAVELLEQRFAALTVKGMPLSDFLSLVARLGGVPISVAPQQLQMAGITSRQSVSYDAKDFSLAEALRSVLEPLRLEQVAVGEQVVVVRRDAAKVRTIDYPLEDLLNSTTSLEDLVGWVELLVAPAARLPADRTVVQETTASKMSIKQAQQFQYQVLIFLERLRLARGIPPRSRFPIKRLAGSASNAVLAERLRAPTTFTFSHYTSIDEIVGYWQQELGIPTLVDWPALAALGIWPNSRIACSAENEPWSAAFDQVLEPLGLGWRAVVGGAVEITSAEKVQTELQLELYRLERELGDQTERVLGKLRSIADRQSANIAYDPTGKVLMVLQPAAAQRLVYQWLVDEKLVQGD